MLSDQVMALPPHFLPRFASVSAPAQAEVAQQLYDAGKHTVQQLYDAGKHTVQQLYDAGKHTVQQLADMFSVPRSTVYRHLDKARIGKRPEG